MRTNVSGSHRASSGVNRTMATPCMPPRASASSFCWCVISSGGALSGRTIFDGCGSNVIATAVAPRSSAPRRTRSMIFR